MASSRSPGRVLAITYWARASSRPSPTCQVLRSVFPPRAIRSTDHRRNGTRRPPISSSRCVQGRSVIAEDYGGLPGTPAGRASWWNGLVDITHLLLEIYDRVPPLVRAAVEDLDAEQLVWRPGREANSIGWLVWHLTRVQDHHVAELVADDQIW